MNTCDTCPHFEPLKEECRHNPPQAFVVPGPQGPAVIGVWPATRKAHWCGHHPSRDPSRVPPVGKGLM